MDDLDRPLTLVERLMISDNPDDIEAADEITRLRSAVRELQEALEPFDAAARSMKRSLGTTPDDLLYGVYARDLRAASAAILRAKIAELETPE